ncbi:CARDB domain-containing protein [Halorubrum sp. AS12]|uniref:CARDB domain-containing protein n=1 Tax=Halorubrum sp. AS12 TaxID=3409687 RepID=UPI003DA756E9
MTDITITEGDTLDVSVLVNNLGGETGSQTIRLLVDGTEVDSQPGVALDPGIETNLSLAWTASPGDAGSHTATVEGDDDSVSASVDVLAPAVDVATGAVSDVTPESATVGGDLVSVTGVDEVDADIEYRETGASSWVVVDAATLASPGPFSASLSGLSSSTEYEARAAGAATRYPASDAGSPMTFQTDDAFVSVTTLSVSNVGDDSATVDGELTEMPGVDEVDVGVEYRQTGASSWLSEAAGSLTSPGTFSANLTGLSAATDYEARATADAVNDPASDVGGIVAWTTDAPANLDEEFDDFSRWDFSGLSSSEASISSTRVAPASTNDTSMYASGDISHGEGVSEFSIAMTWNFSVVNQYTRVVWHYNENSFGQGGVGLWAEDDNFNRVFAVGTTNPDPVYFKNGDTNTPAGNANYETWYKWIIDIDWANQTYSLDWNNGSYTGTHNFDGNPSNIARLRWGAFGPGMNGQFDHYQDDIRVNL